MHAPIFLQAALRLAADKAAVGDAGNGDKAITGIAYSGDAVTQWGERLVIDLSTLDSVTPLPILFQHRHIETIGVIDAIGNDGKHLSVEDGRIFAGMESDILPRQIAEKAARGFPYELSVGIYEGSEEEFQAGKSVTVNGREFTGPITVIRNATLREISVVALGADTNTQADIAAAQPHEDITMPDPSKGAGGNNPAGDNAQLIELTARVAELQQHVETEKQRADQAEQALAEFRQESRLNDIKRLLADIGIEYSDEHAKPYLELSDEAFAVLSDQVRGSLNAAGSGHADALFSDASADGDATQSDQGSSQISLSVTDIYAKRRTA